MIWSECRKRTLSPIPVKSKRRFSRYVGLFVFIEDCVSSGRGLTNLISVAVGYIQNKMGMSSCVSLNGNSARDNRLCRSGP